MSRDMIVFYFCLDGKCIELDFTKLRVGNFGFWSRILIAKLEKFNLKFVEEQLKLEKNNLK